MYASGLSDCFHLPANRFGYPLHLFGLYRNAGQNFQVHMALIKRLPAADMPYRAAYARAQRGSSDIQFFVLGDLSTVTGRTMIIGAHNLYWGEHRYDLLSAVIDELGLVALAAVDVRSLMAAAIGIQQFFE